MLTKYKNNKPSHIFNDFINDYHFFDDFISKNNNTISYDVIENDSNYELEVHLSGFNKEDLNLDVEDGKLKISGERKEKDSINYTYRGSYYGKFEKLFNLPKEVSYEKIDAEYVNGVLKITIPKDMEKIKSKLIKIR